MKPYNQSHLTDTKQNLMLSSEVKKSIKSLMQNEIIPAIGCTEPIAVSLCTAKARETLGATPDRIEVFLSANILKNAMGVGIPGTGMIGLPIAIALGALIGQSEYGLEVLQDLEPKDVEKGKVYIDEDRIKIALKPDIDDNLYIEVNTYKSEEHAKAVIKGNHTQFTLIAKNGTVLHEGKVEEETSEEATDISLTFRKVYDYATETPIEELSFILEAAKMNREASRLSKEDNYGHNVAKSLLSQKGMDLFGQNLHSQMLVDTASACDARMDGALIPVMSNSGSGNQGIAATLPVLTFADNSDVNEECLIRALILSHLTVIYIKQYLGRLSALCGCVVASTGSSCGITYLMGGTYDNIVFAAKNMIANITGMICDGAKPSCALKVASSVSTATLSALMAVDDKVVTAQEGIIDEDIDQTIRNLAKIGKVGMQETDKIVLDIMTSK